MKSVLLVHAAATLFMTGLIWFVQIVHYPLFDRVGRDGFSAYEAQHARRTTWVVAPAMLLEAAAAVLLVARRPAHLPSSWVWTGLALLAVIWLSTGILQVPRHAVLSSGFDAGAHRGLVSSNWIRTAAWSLRGGLALAMLSR